jgi:hypothetical protein
VRGNDPACEVAKASQNAIYSTQKACCEAQKAAEKTACEAAKATVPAHKIPPLPRRRASADAAGIAENSEIDLGSTALPRVL